MNIKFNSGNFTLDVTGNVDQLIFEDVHVVEGKEVKTPAAEVAEAGMSYILQRDVATAVYLEVAGVAGKKAGSRTLPPKFERDSVPFNPENAGIFQRTAVKALAKYGMFGVVVTEYVKGGTTLPMSMATTAWEKIMAESNPDKVEMKLEMFGCDLNGSKEEQIASIHRYLSSLRK